MIPHLVLGSLRMLNCIRKRCLLVWSLNYTKQISLFVPVTNFDTVIPSTDLETAPKESHARIITSANIAKASIPNKTVPNSVRTPPFNKAQLMLASKTA